MILPLRLWIGLALSLAAWLLTRAAARTSWSWRRPIATLLDAFAPFAAFAVLLAATAKPLFAGAVVFALIGGFAFADVVKRLVLREPVVFSDMSEGIELFRHPQLYLPFAGPGRVIAGALAAAAVFVVLLILEPPIWAWSPWPGLIGFGLTILFIWALAEPLVQAAAAAMRRLEPSGDPVRDAATYGGLAVQLVQGLIARAERPARRAAFAPPAAPAVRPSRAGLPPAVLIQCESFFDPRRLDAPIPTDLLPAFDRAGAEALQRGRLAVPAWGANTTRTEFQVLNGATEADLGFDRFNPYHAFAKVPLASIAWRLRHRGYRTLCIHPYDRRFYGRDKVMRDLGFDAFLGEEAFAGAARIGPFIGDQAVGEMLADLLREEGEGVFLFAITMQNHGPWEGEPRLGAPDLGDIPEAQALQLYTDGVRDGDAMLGRVTEALSAAPGVLGFYGDHLPSFPDAFAHLGFTETSTDYLIWRAHAADRGERRDIGAHALGPAFTAAIEA